MTDYDRYLVRKGLKNAQDANRRFNSINPTNSSDTISCIVGLAIIVLGLIIF